MTALALFSGQSLMYALGWSLLHFCWQGAIVAVFLACVLALLGERSPQARHMAACLCLALMMVLPLVTFARLATTHEVGASITTTSSGAGDMALNLRSGQGDATMPWLDRVAGALDRSMPWILGIWLSGAILLLVRLNIGLIVARRIRLATAETVPPELQRQFDALKARLRISRPVRLISSAVVEVPTVVGWLRPAILMPMGCLMGLSTLQIEAILAHELAHIRRHDYLVSVLQSFAEALLFYHPAVWWVSKQIRIEREHCCDDVAVKISGDSLAYARALSSLEERRNSLPMAALGANGGVLKVRIRRLLGIEKAPAASKLAAVMLLAAVVSVAGLCIVTVARAQAATDTAAANSEAASQNLPPVYQKWVDEDVRWIITPTERAAYLKLTSDATRNEFIQQFWERRNPSPGAAINRFKQEHYQRIAYANQHFAASVPGWETDRGRIFILYGRPDSIDAFPAGSSGSAKPHETWHYRSLNEISSEQGVVGDKAAGTTRNDVDLKFVDVCSCDDYRLQPIQ